MELDDTPLPELGPGARFGSYEIVRKLGEGGMGAVYEARRQGLNKRVALKVLTLAGDAGGAARFVREARIAATLEHPHVADCIDVGEHGGVPFLALEYLEGETLGARMARGPMAPHEAVDVLLPVCSALAHAHARGLVHRDLKPDNIFLARRLGATVPKVLDFGIAKASGAGGPGITQTRAILGTPRYMSPEQARDSKHVTAASDQFSLGVVLWEAVAGRPLFTGESSLDVLMQVVSAEVPRLRAVAEAAPEALDAAVARLLEREASRRFPSMREVGEALLPLASDACRAQWLQEFTSSDTPPAVAALPATAAPPKVPTTLGGGAVALPIPPEPVRTRRPLLVAVAAVVPLLGGVAYVTSRAAPQAPAPAPRPAAPAPAPPSPVAAPPSPDAGAPPSPDAGAPPVVAPTTPPTPAAPTRGRHGRHRDRDPNAAPSTRPGGRRVY